MGFCLIVEDDDDSRVALLELLTEQAIAVLAAATGEEALLLAAQHHPQFALIDLELGGDRINGLQVLEGIRRCSPGCDARIMSGHQAYALAKYGLDLVTVIQKPFHNMPELLELISQRCGSCLEPKSSNEAAAP